MEITLGEIANAVHGRLNNTAFSDVTVRGVVIDSRDDIAEKLFVPIKGEKVDGHDFAIDVLSRGAACSLSEKEFVSDIPIILVDETKTALADLAAYYRAKHSLRVVGITGSVGKTTTKNLIYSVLSRKFETIRTEGNHNNEIGLPLTVFNIEEDTEYAVLEMGMRNFGEIRYLCEIAKPDIAVITNIGVSHIEILGSREGIFKAKSEIFEKLQPGSTAVINNDDDLLNKVDLQDVNVIRYGLRKNSDVFASDIKPKGIFGTVFTLNTPKWQIEINQYVPGEHMVTNSLCAAAVGFAAGLSPEEVKLGIENCASEKLRMDIFTTASGITVINDTYNANPVSVKAAIDVLRLAEGRRICVLGDMLELGEQAAEMHFDIGKYAKESAADLMLCTGALSINTADAFNGGEHFADKPSLINRLMEEVKQGDTVLIKASRGMEFEQIAEKFKNL